MASKYEFNLVDDSHSHLSPTSLKNLTLKNVPIPEPGPGSVLVRMHAAALNFRDLLTVADSPMYPVRSLPGLVPCSDGAGEIVKTGQDSAWSDNIGQAVILVPGRDWIDGVCNVRTDNVLGAGNLDGTLTQYAVVPDMWLLRCPKNLSYEEAAALVSTAGTALNCLETFNLKKGDTVVAQGTGGVSCAVIQVCSPAPRSSFRAEKRLIPTGGSTPLPWVRRSLRQVLALKSSRSPKNWVLQNSSITKQHRTGRKKSCESLMEKAPTTWSTLPDYWNPRLRH